MPIAKKQLLRFFYLVSELKAKHYPNCSTVAAEMRRADLEDNQNLCCSTKTIFRDIQVLKNDIKRGNKYWYLPRSNGLIGVFERKIDL